MTNKTRKETIIELKEELNNAEEHLNRLTVMRNWGSKVSEDYYRQAKYRVIAAELAIKDLA